MGRVFFYGGLEEEMSEHFWGAASYFSSLATLSWRFVRAVCCAVCLRCLCVWAVRAAVAVRLFVCVVTFCSVRFFNFNLRFARGGAPCSIWKKKKKLCCMYIIAKIIWRIICASDCKKTQRFLCRRLSQTNNHSRTDVGHKSARISPPGGR